MLTESGSRTLTLENRHTTILGLFLLVWGWYPTVRVCELADQKVQIGFIDFYGLNRVSAADARQALTFKEGDTFSKEADQRPPIFADSEERLSKLRGVSGVRTELVCCHQGRVLVFIGIQEDGAPVMRLRPAPDGSVRLAPDIVQAGDEFREALNAAVQRGDAAEDRSQGHSLAHDPVQRAIQERFIGFAHRDPSALRQVLRESSDAKHRALAAQVMGYVADKQAVVDDLVYGMSDPSEDVRNNAMRALLVLAAIEPTAARPVPRIPYQPFMAFLSSPVWSDRNKASGALLELTKNREAALLTQLRSEAMPPLVEMARWKSEGHAIPAFIILGRLAGYSDEAALAAWARGDREPIITAALGRR